MKLTQILDRPIAYHRVFVTLTGSVKAAIMLSQALYWQARAKQKDGWWYKTAEEWEEETGLTRHEQQTVRKDCEKYLLSDLRGVPATLYWKVDEDAITTALFDESSKSSLPESVKLDLRNQSNINKNTETTAEITTPTEKTKIIKDAIRKVDAILDNEKKALGSWQGREKMPEPLRDLGDAFVNVTGIKPQKKELVFWMGEFQDWLGMGVKPSDIQEAKAYSTEHGYDIFGPSSMTKTLRMLIAKKATKPRPVYYNPPPPPPTGPAMTREQYEAEKARRERAIA